MTQHGRVPARRFSCVMQRTSGILVGTLHKCAKCERERRALPADQRAVLILSDIEGFSYEEITQQCLQCVRGFGYMRGVEHID